MSSPSPAAKTVGRDTAWGRVNGAIEDVSSTVCGRPDEVAGGGVGNRDESDRAGVDRPGVEQPATSSPTAATAYEELSSRAGGFRRGILRSMELTRTPISPRPVRPDELSSWPLPRSAYATKRACLTDLPSRPTVGCPDVVRVANNKWPDIDTDRRPAAAPEAAHLFVASSPRVFFFRLAFCQATHREGRPAKDWRTL